MLLSKKDIQYCASLARLELTKEEEKRFTSQLSSILDYFAKLGELDLRDVEPIYQVTGQENRLREDEIKNKDDSSAALRTSRENLLKNVPDREGDFIRVKSVF